VTPDDVQRLSGEELVALYGARTEQMIVDLLVASLKKGREEADAIERKLLEVQILHEARRRGGRMT
jgi:hypothetical protein